METPEINPESFPEPSGQIVVAAPHELQETSNEEGIILGENEKDVFMQSLKRELTKNTNVNFMSKFENLQGTDDDVKSFNKQLKKMISKRKDNFDRLANSLTDAQLVKEIPKMLKKYLWILSTVWREQKYVGILDLCFENRNHVKELWVLCQCTYYTYGGGNDFSKFKDVLPSARLLQPDEEFTQKLFANSFAKYNVNEEFCASQIPVHIRILSDEIATGKLPIQVNWIYKMNDKSFAVFDASEKNIPDYVIQKIQNEEGGKAVRKFIAETAIFDASVQFEIDLFKEPAVMQEMESYIENNTFGQVVISVKILTDEETQTFIDSEKITIFFPDYPRE